ncbi:unnamed protein product, partial [Adineta steineri]
FSISLGITEGEFLTISCSIGVTCSLTCIFSTTSGSSLFSTWCDGSICGLVTNGLGGAIGVLGVLCRGLKTGGAGNPGGVVGKRVVVVGVVGAVDLDGNRRR